MRRIPHYEHRDRRGANAIEFALILPVFVMLMMGVMEYSWFFFQRSTIVNAVRDGCRAGAVIPPDEDYETEALAAMDEILAMGGVDCNDADISCTLSAEEPSDSAFPQRHLDCEIEVTAPALMGMVPVPETTSATATVHFELQQ